MMDQWVSKLQSATLSVLPFDFVQPPDGRSVDATLTTDIGDDLLLLAEELDVSSYSVAQAIWALLIFRLTGDEDVVFGASSGEDFSLSQQPIYPLRINSLTGSLKFADLVKHVVANEMFAENHPCPPLREVATAVKSKYKLQDLPTLYRTAFFKLSSNTANNASTQAAIINPVGKTNDLTFFFSSDKLTVNYNSLLFKKERLVILGEQFNAVASRVLASKGDIECGKVSLITDRQTAVLPDPTSDLHWNKFGGAIHDIFAANAATHPDRPCVIETANKYEKDSVDRTFSYLQIHEASNVLAHHLVDSGIVIGDVVMVYAHRSVDLVVSVMGVLKAGATFSVIDPAYPPARQNIYLSVAQPNALIIIEKAGVLAPLVKDYIKDNLSLKTTVPGLAIQDNGILVGGSLTEGGEDVLAPQQKKAPVGTGVIVGPDNNPTLSFTSGSEGIPKGVRGRHFSLTYYFPWMAKTFNLSENDRFTMLSGIAHDPIQRDIFTPLFLGAKLLVPTADDIGTPGRLAEWMGEQKATVTHLTPAMGQLLSAQATAEIPHLHHAFFVGDILTKRDCSRLQSLAKNVNIINMYGTTETQRAVSYFNVVSAAEDPTFLQSQKDIMPAGKGMIDVQLLIVNRNDRTQTCGVGEVGEIYVRAAGLAEGYLKLPELTAEKFVKNWYKPEGFVDDASAHEPWRTANPGSWLGIRDRLYRTGDLGRYLPDGNTECSGRADSQVKIRGFRIELGEIDTHLSQHPLVRENVTLVRRDKDEEPVLISYVVPHSASKSEDTMFSAHESLDEEDEEDSVIRGLVQYRKLIKNIKDYMKTKLPSYAVPTVIVPLSQLPLNPNGKVDKPALPFPDTARLSAVARHTARSAAAAAGASSLTPLEKQVAELWLEVLPQRPAVIEANDSFFDLGGHSILATRLIFEARKKFKVEIPLNTVFRTPTLKDFASTVEKLQNSGMIHHDNELTDVAQDSKATVSEYADDAKKIVEQFETENIHYTSGEPFDSQKSKTVFVTGVTGYVGSFILRDLMERDSSIAVIAHVRAKTPEAGLERIINSGIAYGTWKDSYKGRVKAIVGALEQKQFGLSEDEWTELCATVDTVIHNGALVHWVYPYSVLRSPNVIGTLNVMDLCRLGKPKYFTFVSSTAVLESEYFIEMSDALLAQGKSGIPESDDLHGSESSIATGYGQSKWAGEYIIRAAANFGLRGTVVRPGYIFSDSQTGVCTSDDFLIRMMKGCLQLKLYPDIINTVNMVPVDHVARVVTASAFHPSNPDGVNVAQVTAHPKLHFNEWLSTMSDFGYELHAADYVPWRVALEKYVTSSETEHALFPLLHFVLDNLPQDTKTPELDDTNARTSLKQDAAWTHQDLSEGAGVNKAVLGKTLAYLVATGFIDPPADNKLPDVEFDPKMLEKLSVVGGRSK